MYSEGCSHFTLNICTTHPRCLGLLKEQVEGHRSHNNEEEEVAVCEWLRMQDHDLYCDRIFKLVSQDVTDVSICSGGVEKW